MSIGPSVIEAGRRIFSVGEKTFVAGATTVDALPPSSLVEIAFAGRSNVGKSSLLNALTGRNALARVSHTPGRTQQINFFSVAGRCMLVDLPGYGYARAPKKRVAEWSDLIVRYLRGRPKLRRVLSLVDTRHGLKDSDRGLYDLLDEAAVSYQVVLTKADTCHAKEIEARVAEITAELATHAAAHPEILVTSASKGHGIPELRGTLAMLLRDEGV
jgi:GTP-binding protein